MLKIIVLLIGIFCIAVSIYSFAGYARIRRRCTVEVDGYVSNIVTKFDNVSRKSYDFPFVSYVINDGTVFQHLYKSNAARPGRWPKGAQVRVHYDPNDPDFIFLDGDDELGHVAGLLSLIVGVVLLIVSVFI